MLPVTVRVLLIGLVLTAGYFDIYSRRIPNFLTIPALAFGLILNTILFAWAGATYSAEGLGLALLAYIPLYLLRGMGAGDVKLMAAVGAIAGPTNWLLIFLITSVLGGVAAVGLVLAQRRLLQTWFNLQALVASLVRFRAPWAANGNLDIHSTTSSRLPHGAVIACGAILCTYLGYLG